MRHSARRYALYAALFCCALLLAVGMAAPAGAGGATPPAGGALHGSPAPLNPAFLPYLLGPPIGAPWRAAGGHALGDIPGPQDFSYARGMQVPGVHALALPATYDLRPLGKVSSVKNQAPYGTCWAFGALGSLESCLLPGETWDFSENNMVANSGFGPFAEGPYEHGGTSTMATAYLVRWGGPVNESDDPYGGAFPSPPGLAPRKHVQEIDWIPARGSALDNDNIKNAVMLAGGVDVSMSWHDSSYNAATTSYYYNDSVYAGHAVLVVGWDDNYSAANFATTPAGNGAFIVKNSWGASWGNAGYFYASYYDSMFGRAGKSAVFDNAEPTSNYSDIYQYDPLGDVGGYGYSSSTGWFANVFSARTTSSLSAVGFYAAVPGTSYEVYTGSSLATKTLSTSGTQAHMGYHTVTLPSAVGLTSGQQFVVFVKVTTPGYNYPIAIEYPIAGYSEGATALPGQSYTSSTGASASWTDLTTWNANANVCLKAYVRTSVAPPPTVTSFSPITGPVGTSVSITGTGFTGATAVTFNGAAATTRAVVSDTLITATVPAGATSGAIAVTTPNGTGWSPGSFAVTGTGFSLTVTAPTGAGSYAAGATLTVSWTTSGAVSSGEFGVWARSGAGGWYIGKMVAASGGALYSTGVTLDVPAGGGYEAIVAYRPIAGSGEWSNWGVSPGSFTVTGTGFSLTVTAPTGAGSYAAGATLTVSWTTSGAASSGEFGVWARSPGGWYIAKMVPASGGTSFSTGLTLDVPAGGGYEAIVAWRPTAGSGAWSNWGVSPGSFTVTGTGLAIGDPYQGGIIAYIDGSGLHGLIAAAADQSLGIRWYNGSYAATGATATALGTGMANTNRIIASQGGTATSYAAGLARAYTGGGYTDWYLPSLDELDELYYSQDAIGGFESTYYWSSSEVDAYGAADESFVTGYQYDSDKSDWDGVRAVRTF